MGLILGNYDDSDHIYYTAASRFSLTASYYAYQCYLGLIRNIGVYLMGYPVHTNIQCHNGPIYASNKIL